MTGLGYTIRTFWNSASDRLWLARAMLSVPSEIQQVTVYDWPGLCYPYLLKFSKWPFMTGLGYTIHTFWNSASDRLWLAWAILFMASTSGPLYFRANLPLTIACTSSALKCNSNMWYMYIVGNLGLKKKCVFRVTCLKILGLVGSKNLFFFLFFLRSDFRTVFPTDFASLTFK